MLLLLAVLLAGNAPWAVTEVDERPDAALVMEIDGSIGPITAEYFRKGLRKAEQTGAQLVVLRMDTPGGLDAAMRDIIKDILAASLPVACHVAPSGARAASAGTYILYACHVAAMAPGHHPGFGHPGAARRLPRAARRQRYETGRRQEHRRAGRRRRHAGRRRRTDSSDSEPKGAINAGSAMERKIINDAAAFIRGLAKLRGRNAEWAEKAVREAEDLTSGEALEHGVIDLIANDSADLLAADRRTRGAAARRKRHA